MSIDHRAVTTYVVCCDNCDIKSKHIYEGHGTIQAARLHAQEQGWDLGIVDLCYSCACQLGDHWLNQASAIGAARAQSFRFDLRYTVYRCTRCGLWTIAPELDDE